MSPRSLTRSLTRTEAEQRSALIAVERYDIAVDLTALPTGPDVKCVSTVTFTCHTPGTTTFIDCAARVLNVTLNGAPLTPADTQDGRITLPGLAERNVLRVESVQSETSTGAGVHKAVDPADGEIYVWTTFEPDEARHVWACFDQPDLKAPHAFTVTAPAAWTVTSNSGDPRIEEADPGARRWTFPATPPLATYNTVVNAGPYHGIRREADGYDLGLYARRSLAHILDRDADDMFTLTRQGLAFFGEVFAMPFPQRKYDQVFAPEFGGAMENYGCVTWSDGFLRRSAPTPAENELLAKVLLHEMAHMWFGNIVTMRWWDDLWLNEAFAEFACNWAAARATRHTDAWANHLAADKVKAYLADQGPVSHPIHQPIHDVAQAASIFDNITYPKGASVLHQLMTYVGEKAFTAGMAGYFARHAWGSTTLQDLIDALAESSGRDLNAWRTAWLETAGTDRFTLERDGDSGELTLVAASATPRPQVLAIGAYTADDGSAALERTALVRVEVTGPRTPVPGLPSSPAPHLLLVNDDDLTFATTRPGPATRSRLFDSAARLPTPLSRGVATATVWDMLTTGDATAAETGSAITAVLAGETSDAVVEHCLTMALDIAELWAPESQRADLSAELATVCRRLAENPDRRRVALRGLARTASTPEDLAWLREQATAADDIDLRWHTLIREAELGTDVTAETAALLERDPDPDASARALAVRAATPDAAAKAETWQKLAVDRAVPLSAVRTVTTAFWRPAQDTLLAPYAQQYLDLIPRLDRGGMIPAMFYTVTLFPPHAIGPEYIDTARKTAESAAPVVHKNLMERSDVVLRMLRSRGRHG